jgi:uncharacterized protein (TIGR04222 family)
MVTISSDTWGIGGPTFLSLYAGLCVLVLAAAWIYQRRLRGGGEPRGGRSEVDLYNPDIYDLAMLGGGPALATTTAAARLRQDGLLRPGSLPGTLQAPRGLLHAEAQLAARAEPLERAVFEAVVQTPDIAAAMLCRALEESAPMVERRDRLTACGLLLDESAAARLRRALWTAGGGVIAIGIARLVAGLDGGHPVGFLVIALVTVAGVSLYVARRCPRTTLAGGALLSRRRRDNSSLKSSSAASPEIPLAVALFGTGALWIADPSFATAWGAPREAAYGAGWGSGGGGGCGGGCGGCGG